MADNVIIITQDELDEVRSNNPKLVVDCWADWCGPCRLLTPILEKLAQDYAGRITFAKMNVDENQEAAQRFRIMAIPTILVFKDGKVVDQLIGLMPREDIEEVLRKHF
ncbi:MAG: thioredoxin [Euryarchaeota archaeon]|mgnify:CR=1 FL=1|nr:thioredoxin [Euryarchaeota archaeon]